MNKIREERKTWLLNELDKAYLDARRGKRKKRPVIEFSNNTEQNLQDLAEEIHRRTYHPNAATAFIIFDPVHREIFAADFRDRVVHHFLFNQVEKWWDAHFISDNYSCRKKRGTLYGVRRLEHHIRSVSRNYCRPAYILKLDISGYFMSLPRLKVYKRAIWGLDRQFPQKGYQYQICKYLWKEIVFHDPIKDVKINCPSRLWHGLPKNKSLFNQPPGVGVAIGNLTSQLLSNIYLDQLDRFVTFNLRFKHYGRYVDDFYIVSINKADLIAAGEKIACFLKTELGLTLHPHKHYLQECHRGAAFLGATVYPHRIHPGKRLKRNLIRGLSDPNCSMETRASYTGLVKHFKHNRLLNSIKRPMRDAK